MKYEKLFSPMKIGGCEIKNRIVMSPMLMGFGQFDGCTNDMLMDYYEERAKGGTGLIITEITRINDFHGSAAFAQLGMSHDYQIDGMRALADRIHKHGAKLFVQLHHPGRQNVGLAIGTVPMCIAMTRVWKGFPKTLFKLAPKIAPTLAKHNICLSSVSASKCEPAYFAGGRVRGLRKSEIKKLIRQFVDGAVRCQKAGVDGVELHGTHGYLIQQFLSPNTNQRTDEYGGSFENRLRFLREIVEGIREKCGDYPIIVRLTIDEFYDKIGKAGKGYALETGVEYAKAIAQMGVDAIDVSSAGYDTFNYWLEPTSFELGWRKYLAEEVKKAVDIPVIAANLIRSPEQAEKQLQDGVQDFVSLGRPHIADPHWAEKAMCGKEDEIKRCVCCLYCIQSMQDNAYLGDHGYCSVNPAVGKEREYDNLPTDGNGRVVVIVGGGIGGLMTAELLGKRGFKPIVLERENEVGGQVYLASLPPKKDKIHWAIEDALAGAKRNGAEIHCGVTATPEIIDSFNPYAVVIATGAEAVKPRSIVGADQDFVYTTTDVLTGKSGLENKNVVVVGSGMTGLETAHYLAEMGNKVTIVEMMGDIAPGVWFQHKDDIMPKLSAKSTEYYTAHKLLSIGDKSVTINPVEYVKNKNYNKEKKMGKTPSKTVAKECGEPVELSCDAVVLSLGVRSNNNLTKDLEGKYEGRVFTIGDAVKSGRIADATQGAYTVAKELK